MIFTEVIGKNLGTLKSPISDMGSVYSYLIFNWRCHVANWVFESIFEEKFGARDINSELVIDSHIVFKSTEINVNLYAAKTVSWTLQHYRVEIISYDN